MDASAIHARRLNAEEVISPKFDGNCKFPVEMEKYNFLEEIRFLRTSTLIRDNPETRRSSRRPSWISRRVSTINKTRLAAR